MRQLWFHTCSPSRFHYPILFLQPLLHSPGFRFLFFTSVLCWKTLWKVFHYTETALQMDCSLSFTQSTVAWFHRKSGDFIPDFSIPAGKNGTLLCLFFQLCFHAQFFISPGSCQPQKRSLLPACFFSGLSDFHDHATIPVTCLLLPLIFLFLFLKNVVY